MDVCLSHKHKLMQLEEEQKNTAIDMNEQKKGENRRESDYEFFKLISYV
jgi:hypothetical protein